MAKKAATKPALKLTPRLKQSVKPTPTPPAPPKAKPKAAKPKAAKLADEKAPSPEFEKVLAAVGDVPGVTRLGASTQWR